MATKKRNKKISFTEFMAWISGVEDMQPSDWHPNEVQWNTIREKLDLVKPDEIEVIIEEEQRIQPSMHSSFIPAPTSQVPGTPHRPTGVPTLPSAMQASGASSGELSATKTPNIDTSDGGYESNLV